MWFRPKAPKRKEKPGKLDFFAIEKHYAEGRDLFQQGKHEEAMKGKEIAIAFNPRYLIDALNALGEDEVFFELIDELSPGVLKINGPFLYVVMPMRLS